MVEGPSYFFYEFVLHHICTAPKWSIILCTVTVFLCHQQLNQMYSSRQRIPTLSVHHYEVALSKELGGRTKIIRDC